MDKLPLFPLGSVLFPGMSISLHIFEERYKEMIGLCIESRQPFGVVLIKEGREALGPLATPHLVGCTAQIVRMQPLAYGTMDIVITGQERFLIRELHHDKAYLTGTVETLPLTDQNAKRLRPRGASLRPKVARYLEILAKAGNENFDPRQLPMEPVELAYLGAALLQTLSPVEKQELLKLNSAVELIDRVRAIYHREVTLLDMMMARDSSAATLPFSLN
jgi:hypothetical protein